jgi:hypothetical protein
MAWAILLIIIIVPAFAIPKFGKALLGLGGILLILAALGAVVLYKMDRQQRAEHEVAKTRIKLNEVELVDLVLRPGHSTGSYTLVGRIRNQSTQYTLSEVRLKLTMRDCKGSNDCEIVGETKESLYTSVPPGQARDLDEYVHFSGMRQPRGKYQWEYQIVEILGR